MDEYARSATLDDLKTLLRALNEHGVEYLLIGGYALAAHGQALKDRRAEQSASTLSRIDVQSKMNIFRWCKYTLRLTKS